MSPINNKQLVIRQFDKDIENASSIQTAILRDPYPGEILVRNHFVGINALYDRELYRGAVPYIDVTFPYVFGVESVGTVVQKGRDVKKYQIGDAVSIVKVGSAYQEYQLIKSEDANRISEVSPELLTINPTGISAHLAVEKEGQVKEGEVVVVSAAAGGLGHIITQLCKLKKCHVVGICGSAKKVQLLKDLGSCDRIINYRKESVEKVLQEEYPDRINVAFDSVGGALFDAMLSCMAPQGRLVVCGLASELSKDQFEKVNRPRAYESIYWKGASIRCFMNHLYKEHHPWSRQVLTNLYNEGSLKIIVDKTKFEGVDSIIAASKYLLGGKSLGKVIVSLR